MRQLADQSPAEPVNRAHVADDHIWHAGPALRRAVVEVDFQLPPSAVCRESGTQALRHRLRFECDRCRARARFREYDGSGIGRPIPPNDEPVKCKAVAASRVKFTSEKRELRATAILFAGIARATQHLATLHRIAPGPGSSFQCRVMAASMPHACATRRWVLVSWARIWESFKTTSPLSGFAARYDRTCAMG